MAARRRSAIRSRAASVSRARPRSAHLCRRPDEALPRREQIGVAVLDVAEERVDIQVCRLSSARYELHGPADASTLSTSVGKLLHAVTECTSFRTSTPARDCSFARVRPVALVDASDAEYSSREVAALSRAGVLARECERAGGDASLGVPELRVRVLRRGVRSPGVPNMLRRRERR